MVECTNGLVLSCCFQLLVRTDVRVPSIWFVMINDSHGSSITTKNKVALSYTGLALPPFGEHIWCLVVCGTVLSLLEYYYSRGEVFAATTPAILIRSPISFTNGLLREWVCTESSVFRMSLVDPTVLHVGLHEVKREQTLGHTFN